jgi:hypothetical protein
MNPANNAMSVWNPNVSTPSPTSLLASLFGPQPFDMFQPIPNLGQPAFPMPEQAAQFEFDFTDMAEAGPSSPDRYKHGFNWNMVDSKVFYGNDRIPVDHDSSDSTPISLNSNTAFNEAFSLVQPEYRDRPEHPAYLYQLQVLDQPDQLAQFFPSLEQRHAVGLNHRCRLTRSTAISSTKHPNLSLSRRHLMLQTHSYVTFRI